MLPKRLRLTSDREIKEIISTKVHRIHTPLFSFSARPNGLSYSRMAVVTSRKIGIAVVRNRLRRLFKAAFLKIYDKNVKNYDIVLFPKSLAADRKPKVLSRYLEEALIKGIKTTNDKDI
ncbi:ribonuclease P protein component [Candidatus Saganbacteria bacterium]|nr:ribonuclease P protein component [Candidatus Saganbacteria bacterium]